MPYTREICSSSSSPRRRRAARYVYEKRAKVAKAIHIRARHTHTFIYCERDSTPQLFFQPAAAALYLCTRALRLCIYMCNICVYDAAGAVCAPIPQQQRETSESTFFSTPARLIYIRAFTLPNSQYTYVYRYIYGTAAPHWINNAACI